ncbi:tyrosine-type recombinase/integrase [Natronococcus sp.]|uniref:tyrosine-type recombinase/integrase n=1 Tax=Natronococcus sp. TaxID=35747 RepID=UPI003A4DCACC
MASSADAPDAIEDPIAYFLDDQRYHGKSERTLEAYERVLRQFEGFVRERFDAETVSAVGRRECMAWVHSLRERFESSTIATYASYLNRFYEYMNRVGAFEANPMVLVMEELSESIDANPTRRDISVPEMRGFVGSIAHPLERRPASLFVDSEPARGRTVNGEERTASNKRKRETVIPVDDELRRALLEWLAIRPDPVSPADPLFLDTRDSWGERLEPADVQYVVEKHARERGWHRTGGGATENVTPHYFRHFFTTHLRDRTGDRGIVKYLRGDVADDVIDTYTHNWGDQVRTVYERNVYSLC